MSDRLGNSFTLTNLDTSVKVPNPDPTRTLGDSLTLDTQSQNEICDRNFPCWLKGRDRAIAEALEAEGYSYIGLADDFCVEFDELDYLDTDTLGWHIGGAYQELAIDIIHDGALFTQLIPDEWTREQIEAELKRLKRLIEKTAMDWDSQIGNGQLSLFDR